MYRICFVFALLLLTAGIGCNESSTSPAPENNPDGASLLGLTRNHQMRYEIYDSTVIISLDESDTVIYDTTDLYIEITPGQDNQVELAVDGQPHDLLKIDNVGVLHSGQIRPYTQPFDTVFFYPTPVLMPRTFGLNSTWSIDSPPYSTGTGEIRRTLLYLNYGYFTQRRYAGQESVVLPGGSYNTYHFRSFIFSDILSSDTLIRTDEYYAPGVGPVKIVSRYDRSQRLIILLEDD